MRSPPEIWGAFFMLTGYFICDYMGLCQLQEKTMITFKNELPMDHERSLEHLVELWTQDLINHYTDTPFSTNYDACYESAWAEIEEEFHWEKLEMVEI